MGRILQTLCKAFYAQTKTMRVNTSRFNSDTFAKWFGQHVIDHERRRVYDLINICQGLGIIDQRKKRTYKYHWLGWNNAITTITQCECDTCKHSRRIALADTPRKDQSKLAEFTRRIVRYLYNNQCKTYTSMHDFVNRFSGSEHRRLWDIMVVLRVCDIISVVETNAHGKRYFKWNIDISSPLYPHMLNHAKRRQTKYIYLNPNKTLVQSFDDNAILHVPNAHDVFANV